MTPPVRLIIFSVCDLYPFSSRIKEDSLVSQDTVIIIKVNRFLIRFELVFRSANLPVMLRALTVRTDKLLSLRLLSNSYHSALEHWGT